MNKTKAANSATLNARLHAGEVVWFKFEGVKLWFANNTFHTPYFVVMLTDGALETHKVKGYWQDDALTKIKIVGDLYPL